MITADDIQLEKLEAIGHGPDVRGEVQIQCEVTARYPATVNEPLARLRTVVVDESGEWPLSACESPLTQQGGVGQPGLIVLGSHLRTAVPVGIDVNDLGVRPTLLFYPVPWTRIDEVALPPVGQRRCDTSIPCGDLQVNRWWITPRAAVGEFTEYEIGACVENRSLETLALGVVRVVLEDAEKRLLWSELCPAEGIGPGEERVLSSRISVAGGPELRIANRITLSAGGVRAPIVVPLAVWRVEMSTESADSSIGRRLGPAPAGCH